MQRITHSILTSMIGTFAFVVAANGAWAQAVPTDRDAQAGDPARWYQEDITPRDRYQTSKKEAGAAHREAQSQCKNVERISRPVCMQEARNMLERDLNAAKMQLHLTGS